MNSANSYQEQEENKMNTKASFAWWHLMMILLAIALVLFVVFWYTGLGEQMKVLILKIFDIF